MLKKSSLFKKLKDKFFQWITLINNFIGYWWGNAPNTQLCTKDMGHIYIHNIINKNSKIQISCGVCVIYLSNIYIKNFKNQSKD